MDGKSSRGTLGIGEAAKKSGCSMQTVRHYEKIGLLPVAARTAGNRRRFDRDGIRRLRFIRHARELGFSLPSIRDLLALADQPGQSCTQADMIARNQLEQVERRIARLDALKGELEHMIEQCRGGRIAECHIIATLGDHGQCLSPDHRTTVDSEHRAPPAGGV